MTIDYVQLHKDEFEKLGWQFEKGKSYSAVLKGNVETVEIRVLFRTAQGEKQFFHVECNHAAFGFIDETKRPIVPWAIPGTVRRFLDKCCGEMPGLSQIEWKAVAS